uniref:Carbohydrate kinase family protein n=1 Tax=Ignisphaera aggregans TaxID=334771 RepID=A0A7J3MY28_9CREN
MMKLMFIGASICDIILVTPYLSKPGDIVYLDKGITISIGGHPCNISIDLVKLGYKPSDIYIVSAIGEDFCGKFIEENLRNFSLNLKLFKISRVGSNKNIILVVDGEDRRFHAEVGASMYLPLEDVINYIVEVKPRLLHIAPGLLGDIDTHLSTVLSIAKDIDAVTFIDIGVAKPYGKEDWGFLLESLKYVDILHCSRYELKNIFGTEDIYTNIRNILERGVKMVIVTDGEKGAYIAKDGYVLYQRAFKVNAVDPTGAGDAFQAGFLYKLIELVKNRLDEDYINSIGYDELVEILTYAQAVGAICVTEPGTTTAIARENVERLLNEQKDSVIKTTTRIKL